MKMKNFVSILSTFFHLKTTIINRYDFFVFCVAVFVAVKVDDGSTKEEDKDDDV